MAGRVAVLQCGDWIRLLVGKPLALAQPSDSRWRYLVQGIPSEDLVSFGDERGIRLAAQEVRADFRQLRDSLDELKRRVSSAPGTHPETFMRSFHLLWSVNLPVDPSAWLVTDEGVTIVQWGLQSGRQLFEWTPHHLDSMEALCLRRLGDEALSDGRVERGAAAQSSRRISIALGAQAKDPTAARSDRPVSARERSGRIGHWMHEPLLWSVILLVLALGAVGGYWLAMRRLTDRQQPVAAAASGQRLGAERRQPEPPVGMPSNIADEGKTEQPTDTGVAP